MTVGNHSVLLGYECSCGRGEAPSNHTEVVTDMVPWFSDVIGSGATFLKAPITVAGA